MSKTTKRSKRYMYSSKETIKEFEIEIGMSSDFKFYFAGQEIPEELQESYKGTLQKLNRFDDFNDLNSKIMGIIADFESKFVEETKKKVILYEIAYDMRGEQQQIKMSYCVAQRIDTTSKNGSETTYYRERLILGNSDLRQHALDAINTHSLFDEFNEMSWTKERELWFAQMSSTISEVGKKLIEGFGDKAEILARKIDQGMLSTLY